MTKDELVELLGDALTDSAKTLAQKAKDGNIASADIAQLRGLFRECGGILGHQGEPTPVGESIMDSLADVDEALLN